MGLQAAKSGTPFDRRVAAVPPTWRVGVAGLAAIGVSYGFARYGFGLFLPELRAEFGLSVAQIGMLGSVGYGGYFAAVALAGVLTARLGPRLTVVASGTAAAVGMSLVAAADAVAVLAVGLVIAGASPGLAWTPYADAVERTVSARRRPHVLAVIAAGTAFGIVAAGTAALVTGGAQWRVAWLIFVAVALLVIVANATTLPGRGPVGAGGSAQPMRPLWRAGSLPLCFAAFVYGLTATVYWSFAVELVSRGATPASTAVFWTVLGASGTAAVFAGGVVVRLGLRRAQILLFLAVAAATALLGVAPASPAIAAVSAVVYGGPYMAISGLLSIWSQGRYPDRPSGGFTMVALAMAAGSIVGPGLAGAVADSVGLGPTFLLTGVVTALALVVRPGRGAQRDGPGGR